MRMKRMLQACRFLNLISIDVACGAMVCADFYARIFQIQLRPSGLGALGITVWIIYSLDHLLDVRHLEKEASTKRHLFHQQNFRTLTACVIVAMVIDVILVLTIRKPVFSWGIVLAVVVFLYLLFQRVLSPFKELMAAFLYSCGILLPALSLHMAAISTAIIVLMCVFVVSVLINIVLFSWFDWERDLKDKQRSLVTILGKQNTQLFLWNLFFIQALLFIGLFVNSSYKIEAAILFAMNFVLAILFIFPGRFTREDNYRLAGDIIFLFPLPYLIANG